MIRLIPVGAALALSVFATAASAQTPATVEIALGPAVHDRAGELGRSELEQQQTYLRTDVQRALAAGHVSVTAVRLAIVDIEPNRPTSAQLGTSTQLSANSSFGVGGAAVTGEVVMQDGRRVPVRYRFFQDQIRDEANFTTWGDADQAFDDLAHDIGVGRLPHDDRAWPPAHVARALTGTRIPG